MVFILGVIFGLIVLFLLNSMSFFGPLTAGFIAGIVAKGPIAGLVAGLLVALIGFFLTTTSSFTAFAVLGTMNLSNVSHNVEPVSLFKTVFGISGVAIATFGGFIGGLIRR